MESVCKYFIIVNVICWIVRQIRDYVNYRRKEKELLEPMTTFNLIRQDILITPRILTRDEYRTIKQVDWYNQSKFLKMHLTEAGFELYNNSASEGQNGKWFHYVRIWELTQTPLWKVMNE